MTDEETFISGVLTAASCPAGQFELVTPYVRSLYSQGILDISTAVEMTKEYMCGPALRPDSPY